MKKLQVKVSIDEELLELLKSIADKYCWSLSYTISKFIQLGLTSFIDK